MEIIEFNGITKSYIKNEPVIKDLNLTINKGDFVMLIGPSGCGKTTILKLINGLIKPDSGRIYVNNKEINDWDPIKLKRNIGYVIQQIGLFPHMTIMDNISYVLNIKKESKVKQKEKAFELIKLVGMSEEYLSKYPRELSGGQKQRIGVARALAADPDIILMDEPLGAVDEISRRTLQDEILEIYSKLRKTIIFVTHDIQEAIKLGNRIILINNGKIEQSGSREDMIFNPQNRFVKEFFGLKNFSAYLNITSLNKVFKKFSNEADKQKCLNSSIPLVNFDSSILEVIKIMYDNKVNKVGVLNNKGELIGDYKMSY